MSRLEDRGNELRRDIQELYSSMRRSGTLRAVPHHNDIGDFIKAFIPEGIPFDDAEQILRSAGFEVDDRPDAKIVDDPSLQGRDDRHDVIATMSLPSGFMSSATLMVGLRPGASGDYSAVIKIWAVIRVIYV